MKNNKILSIYSDESIIGEAEAFFENDKLITIIDGNDGNYRDEYMNCLFTHFNITVKRIKKLNKKQFSQIPSGYLDQEDEF